MKHAPSPLSQEVMKKIEEGEVHMQSRGRYRIVRLALWGAFVLAVGLVVYVTSVLLFDLDDTGAWALAGAGPEGWQAFVLSLPWMFLGVVVGGIFLLQRAGRNEFSLYRRPLVITLAVITLFVVGGGWLAARTSLHPYMRHGAKVGMIPLVGGMYAHRGMAFRNAAVGTIVESLPSGFGLAPWGNEEEDARIVVTVNPNTRVTPGLSLLVGENVVVLGERQENMVTARIIRTTQDRRRVRLMDPQWMMRR